jgi:hypothetical protein
MTAPKIVFEPGCFDNFNGTQEELDELIGILNSMTADELMANSQPLDLDELMESDPKLAEVLIQQMVGLDNNTPRTLQ